MSLKKIKFGWILIVFLIFSILILAILNYKTKESSYPIYDVHEHLAEGNLDKLLFAMEENNISFTVVLGSSHYTLTLRDPGFEDYEKNNDFLLDVSKSNPILTFCTVDPREEDNLQTLKSCMERGASGLKLYSGHYASFYRFLGPLNRTEMEPTYQYCEENRIPVMFHVNPYIPEIRQEFESVLTEYPELVVDCPHWCLSSINDERFRELYDKYSNLYTDISFGSMFAQDGLERISENPEKYRELVEDYQDRFMFGSDMVLTNEKSKEFARDMLGCYRKMLEQEEYTCEVGERGSKFSVYGTFKGLNLPDSILRKIYYENPIKFLEGKTYIE